MAVIDEISEEPAVVERLLHRAGHELEPDRAASPRSP
jgi:hypothetical protein